MKSISISELKKKGAGIISDKTATYLMVNSKVKSVMVPENYYNMLQEALEDLHDLVSIEERKGEEAVPYKKAVKEIESE